MGDGSPETMSAARASCSIRRSSLERNCCCNRLGPDRRGPCELAATLLAKVSPELPVSRIGFQNELRVTFRNEARLPRYFATGCALHVV